MHELFSFNFPLREYFFCTSPAPHKFSNGPSLRLSRSDPEPLPFWSKVHLQNCTPSGGRVKIGETFQNGGDFFVVHLHPCSRTAVYVSSRNAPLQVITREKCHELFLGKNFVCLFVYFLFLFLFFFLVVMRTQVAQALYESITLRNFKTDTDMKDSCMNFCNRFKNIFIRRRSQKK